MPPSAGWDNVFPLKSAFNWIMVWDPERAWQEEASSWVGGGGQNDSLQHVIVGWRSRSVHSGKATVINPEHHEKHYHFWGFSFVVYNENKFYPRCFVHSQRTVARKTEDRQCFGLGGLGREKNGSVWDVKEVRLPKITNSHIGPGINFKKYNTSTNRCVF